MKYIVIEILHNYFFSVYSTALKPPVVLPSGPSAGDQVIVDFNASIATETLTLFGSTKSSEIYVNPQGYVSIGSNENIQQGSTLPFTNTSSVIISPFYVEGQNMSGKVLQRSVKDQQTLKLANTLIKESYTNLQMNVTSVTVITWDDMEISNSTDNSFQVIIATDSSSSNTVVIFDYSKMKLTLSIRITVQIGISFGSKFMKIPVDIGSIASSSNVDRPGTYIFLVSTTVVKYSIQEQEKEAGRLLNKI